MSTSDERRKSAAAAEKALADFLSDYGNMLWPEERRGLQKSRQFLAREAEK